MRDLLIIALVAVGALYALKRPWIGVMLWTWLSIMNPHRYAWGIAYNAPLAAVAATATLVGLLFTRDRESPFKGGAVVMLVIFMIWMTLSWQLGLDPESDYWQWNKVMKIDLMVIVALVLLHSKQHIMCLMIVCAASLALVGAKGGVFTILNGGEFRVWGPEGSFIEDNNEFALALVMTIPLLRFLQMQLPAERTWARHGVTATILLCAIGSLGSHSRGAFIAIGAMAMFLWWRGKNKAAVGFVMLVSAVVMISFMPDEWSERMSSITHYEEDESAMGRISAWWTAWNVGLHYVSGVGFEIARPALFAMYSPYPEKVHAAHSIYFQILGNHGFIGLALFLGIWMATWASASSIVQASRGNPQAKWCAELAVMCQVSLMGYLVGGAFLSLSYFDLPYYIMVMVVLTRRWMMRNILPKATTHPSGWRATPEGLPAQKRQRLASGA